MTVVLFLLLATGTPAVHASIHPTATGPHTGGPPPTTAPRTSPPPAENENKRIADATVALAQMTFFLALATAAAVIVPLISGALQTGRRRKVALGQLSHIVRLFMDRTSYLNEWPDTDARPLLYGLDTALTRALGDDIGDALSPADADICYGALFSAHGAIARAIPQQQQAKEEPMLAHGIEGSIM